MIINIRKSVLFTIDPDIRFSKEYNLPLGTLKEIYRRYKILEYTPSELCEFYRIKTGRKTTIDAMSRWMWRTDIYIMTLPAIKKGAEHVNTSIFKEQEWKVIKELGKNLASSAKGNTKTLI